MVDKIPGIPDNILFEEVPCYVSIHDLNGRIIKENRWFREVFGDHRDDYCYKVFKQRDSICPICPMDNIKIYKKPYTHEEIFFTANGDPIQVIVNTAPIIDESRNIIAIIEIATDISETKRLQRKLEESTEKYRMLYNEVPCYVSVQDRDFRIIDANRRFKEEYGGMSGFCYEIYKHRTSRCEICPVAMTFEDGIVHTSEEIVASRTGEPMNTLVFAAPIKDSLGNVVSVMEMSTDITSVKRMQTQMANVGQLIATLAHTIKGIITGLEGGMYVVESGFSKNQDDIIKKGWEMVQRNVERVSHLVLDMLYYAKARDPEKKQVQFGKYCKEIYQLYTKKCQETNIECTLNADEDATVVGDPKSLYTLILNLVENAIDACRWDRARLVHKIDINLKDKGKSVMLTIEDNGTGISDEAKAKIFTPMFSTKGSSGSGFGLMVTKKIVEEHGGTITVESEFGSGAKFIVELPKTHEEIQNLKTTIE